jgi:hypothetical protein
MRIEHAAQCEIERMACVTAFDERCAKLRFGEPVVSDPDFVRDRSQRREGLTPARRQQHSIFLEPESPLAELGVEQLRTPNREARNRYGFFDRSKNRSVFAGRVCEQMLFALEQNQLSRSFSSESVGRGEARNASANHDDAHEIRGLKSAPP